MANHQFSTKLARWDLVALGTGKSSSRSKLGLKLVAEPALREVRPSMDVVVRNSRIRGKPLAKATESTVDIRDLNLVSSALVINAVTAGYLLVGVQDLGSVLKQASECAQSLRTCGHPESKSWTPDCILLPEQIRVLWSQFNGPLDANYILERDDQGTRTREVISNFVDEVYKSKARIGGTVETKKNIGQKLE